MRSPYALLFLCLASFQGRAAGDISFAKVAGADGEFCYNATARTRADYVSFDTVSTRTECEDLCATDTNCNFYGWYEGESKCGACHLYTSCNFRRESACTGTDAPVLYKKSEAAERSMSKTYVLDMANNGMYCDGSEIMFIPKVTIQECKGFCSRLSKCSFLAFYRNGTETQQDEDVKSDACSIQCRIFKDCNSPKFSVCRPNPVLYAVITTSTSTTTTQGDPEPFILNITGSGETVTGIAYEGVAITASGKAIFAPRDANKIGILDIATNEFTTIDSKVADQVENGWFGCAAVGNTVVFVPHYASKVGIFDSDTGALNTQVLSPDPKDGKFAGGAAVGDVVVFAPHNGDRIGAFNVQSLSYAEFLLPTSLPSMDQRFLDAVVVNGLVVFCPYRQNHVLTFDMATNEVKAYYMGRDGPPNVGKFSSGTAVGSKAYFAPSSGLDDWRKVGVFDVEFKTWAEVGGDQTRTYWGAAAIGALVYFGPTSGDVLVLNTMTNVTSMLDLNPEDEIGTRSGAADPNSRTAIFAPLKFTNLLLIK